MEPTTMTYTPHGGADIKHACAEAVRLATENGCAVKFKFNDTEMTATPETDPDVLASDYMTLRRAAAEAYWASPAGIAEKARIETEEQRRREKALKPLATFDCIDPEGWSAFVVANADDYGSGVVRYAARWAA